MPEEQLELEPLAQEPLSEETDAELSDEVAAARDKLLESVAAHETKTVEQRVARLLNFFPETRNSDITLQLRYWEEFEAEYNPAGFLPEDLYKLKRLTTLTRARARIQNAYRLFQADAEIRKHRGTLEKEAHEYEADAASYPVYTVYADESGKSHGQFIVGSYWILEGHQNVEIYNTLQSWKDSQPGAPDEFHFQNVKASNLDIHKAFIDVIVDNMTAASFKYVTVPRQGLRSSDAYRELFCQLMSRGVAHEHGTGRATLPRNLQLLKDADEEGADKLLFEHLRERLVAASKNQFDGGLFVDLLHAVKSHRNILIQVADLFTSSVNRIVNGPASSHAKDTLAKYFLDAIDFEPGKETSGDMVIDLFL